MTEEWSSLVSFRMGTNSFGETGSHLVQGSRGGNAGWCVYFLHQKW